MSIKRACSALLLAVVVAGSLSVSPAWAAGRARGPKDGVGGRPDIPKETCWQTPEGWDERPDVAGSTGDGSNSLSFTSFDDGDIIVAIQSLSVGHAGIWDDRYDRGVSSRCVWSAVKSSPGCVLREAPIKYRTYDRAYGLWVPSVASWRRASARSYAAAQAGEKYDMSSSKSSQSRWYCSKLVWAGYKYRANVDLDANGGYWVAPVDLYNDTQTRCFASAS